MIGFMGGLARSASVAVLLLLSAAAAHAQLAQRFQHEGQLNYVYGVSSMRTGSNNSNPCSVANSSSITISGIPAGATVVGAYLYWAGSGSPDNTVTFAGRSTSGAGYTGTYLSGLTLFRFFGARADVTARITGNGTFTLSGLSVTSSGSYCSSEAVVKGWSLLVVYRHASQPIRRITVFDGLHVIRNASASLTPGGFMAAPAQDSRISLLVWEGDATISGGESLSFNGTSLDASGDVFDSSTGHGVDLETFDVSSLITPGDRSANVSYVTNDDLMVVQTAVTSLSIATVDVTPKSGSVLRQHGTGYSQTFVMENTSLASDNFDLRASCTGAPAFLQIDSITGTGIIGATTGDSVRVNVPAQATRSVQVWYTVPAGAPAANTLTLTARSITYPAVAEATSSGSVNVSRPGHVDLALVKTSSPAFIIGRSGTYSVEVTNIGTAASSGAIMVRDTLPAGLNYIDLAGTGWSIGTSGVTPDGRTWGDLVYGGSIAPGGSVTATISVSPTAAAGSSVTNTAWVRGGGDSNAANNSSSVTTAVGGTPAIAVFTTVSPSGSVQPGSVLTYEVAFANTGAGPAVDVVVEDELPDDVMFQLGSATYSLPDGITAAVEYFAGDDWNYTPLDGGCHIREGYFLQHLLLRWISFCRRIPVVFPLFRAPKVW